MPFGDRTGRFGLGPMTGCGRGWRHWYWATGLPGWVRAGMFPFMPYYDRESTPKEEMAILKQQAEFLKKQLDDVQKRMSTLEKAQES